MENKKGFVCPNCDAPKNQKKLKGVEGAYECGYCDAYLIYDEKTGATSNATPLQCVKIELASKARLSIDNHRDIFGGAMSHCFSSPGIHEAYNFICEEREYLSRGNRAKKPLNQ